MTLREKLDRFIIPEGRKNIEDISNLRWLLRNLQCYNSDNTLYDEVIQEIKYLLKEENKCIF